MWLVNGLFQHTAARRRLQENALMHNAKTAVSTHSRAEAAASDVPDQVAFFLVSTHSRAEAAARKNLHIIRRYAVSTHSRAEAAANSIFTD